LPNRAQEELRHRELLPLRERAGIVLKKLYNGIITTSVVFTAEEKIIQEKIRWWLTYGGIILSVGFILSFLFSTFFAREMKVIAEKTKIVGQGSLDVLFQVKRSDELGLISHELNGMVSGLREKKIMKSTFGRIVDPRVRDHLLEGGSELGGELKIATILFSDIRNFTTMSEILSPEDVVSLINRYFERMSTCINANDGIINKFIGDAILAVFGVPIAVENHAKKAVKAAIMMREANRELNIELRKEGLMEIKSAIGIHTGKVLAGNIGSKNRMEYTVIGDTVNIASRLEGLCKMYDKKLIISEQTLKNLPEKYQSAAKFIDDVVVKGKNKSVKIFSL
jgi:adenylate cyclase